MRQGLGRYMFFCDLEGAERRPGVAEAIAALRPKAESVRILGSYPARLNAEQRRGSGGPGGAVPTILRSHGTGPGTQRDV